ncbi:MAG: hypothetical protein Q7R83_02940 [bacterium]|nr:hypothetical protein [bacterium]
MNTPTNENRSKKTAAWLFAVAFLVIAIYFFGLIYIRIIAPAVPRPQMRGSSLGPKLTDTLPVAESPGIISSQFWVADGRESRSIQRFVDTQNGAVCYFSTGTSDSLSCVPLVREKDRNAAPLPRDP